jgi:sulfur relay (sulfurtransferase) complex TusBCD TusD component (DsrE family)
MWVWCYLCKKEALTKQIPESGEVRLVEACSWSRQMEQQVQDPEERKCSSSSCLKMCTESSKARGVREEGCLAEGHTLQGLQAIIKTLALT